MRWFLTLVLLSCLTACSPVAPPPTPPPSPEQPPEQPETPPDGIPECLRVPNRYRSDALTLELGTPVEAVTGELYYRARLPAGSYRAAFNELFEFGGFGFFVYQEAFAPVASLFTNDYTPFFTFDFELEEPGITVFRLTHRQRPIRVTCETYVFTVIKLR